LFNLKDLLLQTDKISVSSSQIHAWNRFVHGSDKLKEMLLVEQQNSILEAAEWLLDDSFVEVYKKEANTNIVPLEEKYLDLLKRQGLDTVLIKNQITLQDQIDRIRPSNKSLDEFIKQLSDDYSSRLETKLKQVLGVIRDMRISSLQQFGPHPLLLNAFGSVYSAVAGLHAFLFGTAVASNFDFNSTAATVNGELDNDASDSDVQDDEEYVNI
jgi:hypothetical protein